jgi:hypothetical protein
MRIQEKQKTFGSHGSGLDPHARVSFALDPPKVGTRIRYARYFSLQGEQKSHIPGLLDIILFKCTHFSLRLEQRHVSEVHFQMEARRWKSIKYVEFSLQLFGFESSTVLGFTKSRTGYGSVFPFFVLRLTAS